MVYVFAFGFMGTVKVDDKVKATLSELDNSTSNFLVRQMFRYARDARKVKGLFPIMILDE